MQHFMRRIKKRNPQQLVGFDAFHGTALMPALTKND
jgi:hypothetical protein